MSNLLFDAGDDSTRAYLTIFGKMNSRIEL